MRNTAGVPGDTTRRAAVLGKPAQVLPNRRRLAWALAAVSALVREAADKGAKLILPPELFEGHYFCRTQDEGHFARDLPQVRGQGVGAEYRYVAGQASYGNVRVDVFLFIISGWLLSLSGSPLPTRATASTILRASSRVPMRARARSTPLR